MSRMSDAYLDLCEDIQTVLNKLPNTTREYVLRSYLGYSMFDDLPKDIELDGTTAEDCAKFMASHSKSFGITQINKLF